MNWLKLLQFIPIIVAGIEHIHGDAKSGAEKKQLALESLGFASGLASSFLPNDKALVDSFTNLAGNAIDTTVMAFNSQGWPNKAESKTPPVVQQPTAAVTEAPAPTPTPGV